MRSSLLTACFVAMGCSSATTSEGPADSARPACPHAWVASEGDLTTLPDVSEEIYLPKTNPGPPSEADRARVRSTLALAPEWCTAHTTEVERAYVLEPTPATLHWYGRFMDYEGRDAQAHAAYTRFLRTPSPNEEWRAYVEKELPQIAKRTARIGIVCDGPASLDEVGARYRYPFPADAILKPLTCPVRAAVRVSNGRDYDLIATAPGCSPVKRTILHGQGDVVLRLR